MHTAYDSSHAYPQNSPVPFIKWAGGKSNNWRVYQERFPRRFATYWEPFLGGGGIFFKLCQPGTPPPRAILSDINPHLISTWMAIQQKPGDTIDQLSCLCEWHKKIANPEGRFLYYLRFRREFNESYAGMKPGDVKASPHLAASFIFLNKVCFNGLYRVNERGEFNTSVGKDRKGEPYTFSFNPQNIESVSAALQNATILCQDFRAIAGKVKLGDLVYFDPPYTPISKTSDFESYTAKGFSHCDRLDLRDLFVSLYNQGARVFLSESSAPSVRDMYAEFRIQGVLCPRAINSKGEARGNVVELLISA